MLKEDLNNQYFEWMYQLVCDNKYTHRTSYRKLLTCLHDIPFDYIIEMDGNRAEDGINLRYEFGDEMAYEGPMIASYIDDKPCSVLEMMVALSIRCEVHIMSDPDRGNRVPKWFWEMVANLGLQDMDDYSFDKGFVISKIRIFLNRQYRKDGYGGLFTVKNSNRDMRDVEIWYQMLWYLDSII